MSWRPGSRRGPAARNTNPGRRTSITSTVCICRTGIPASDITDLTVVSYGGLTTLTVHGI
ncbi:hypothetical protein [Streptomyces sp. Agncl-13]|uniref:hypothetical protein n=1 Tax=Streptomyces sp. Agncl-13 TaxID=3400628 RepID=UPI003A84D253